MAAVRQLPTLSDFSLGELAPEFSGRIDDPVYRKGGSSFINFEPMRQGGFRKVPGTLYVGHTSSDAVARLQAIVVNQSTAYIAEFTNNKIRFWKWSSGTLSYLSGQDITTTYLAAELNALQFAWTYPYLFITHQNHPPAMITWTTGDLFSYKNIPFSGSTPEYVTGTIATGTAVTLTAGSLVPDQTGGSTYTHYAGYAVTGAGVPTGTTIASVTDATHFTLSQAATNASGVSLTLSAPYLDGQTPALPFQSSGNYPRTVCVAFQRVWFANTVNNPLGMWGSVVGYFDEQANMQMGTYDIVTYTTNTMDLDSSGQPTTTPPTYTSTTWRRNVIGDADGIYFVINSDRNDEVQWIAPSVDLFVSTATGLWVIPGQSTANNVSIQIVSRTGSAALQGSMVEGGCVFASPFGRRIGQVGWQGVYNPWIPPDDLTFYSEHLFSINTATLWNFQQNPQTRLWFLRSDGQLVCLLMDTAHQVRAWYNRTTAGTVTSLAVIPGSNRDVVVLSVTRNSYNLIEIVDDPDWYDTTATNNGEINANYLDAAVTQTSGTPFTTVSGLGHLDGLTVEMVGDGAYLGTAVVSAGAVTLPTASKVAHVGLAFTSTFQSMPLEIGDPTNSTIGLNKSTVRARLRFFNTLDCSTGPDASHLQSASLGGVDVTKADPTLFTGDEEIGIDSDWRTPAYIEVQSAKPLPCTVTAIEVQLDIQ